MKKNIFQTLLVLAFLFISGFSLSEAVACPSAYRQILPLPAPMTFEGNWNAYEFVYQYHNPNGCRATVIYDVCFRINVNSGLHEIALASVRFENLTCSPESIYNSDLIDALIIDFIGQPEILAKLNLTEIPYCPTSMCLLRIYDRICYSGWSPIGSNGAIMKICNDGQLRSCNESIYVCIDPVTNKPQITRSGYPFGPECERGCFSLDCHQH